MKARLEMLNTNAFMNRTLFDGYSVVGVNLKNRTRTCISQLQFVFADHVNINLLGGRVIKLVWLEEEKEKNKKGGVLLVLTLHRSEFRMDHTSC